MREPCPLPLVALAAHETCPRCGRPAREHRGHPSYQETTMTETTEPTLEQIERIATMPAAATLAMGRERIDLRILAAMAIRTLDAEAKLRETKRERDVAIRDAAFFRNARDREIEYRLRDESKRDEVRFELAAMTERAELAERERGATSAALNDLASGLRDALGDFPMVGEKWTDAVKRLRKQLAEVDLDRDEAVSVMREMRVAWDAAIAQRDAMRARLADAERRIASATQDAPAPTTDARLDCESSSLLLLSMWARRVMMREKNRDKGVPSESVEELIVMARKELSEARDAIEENAPTDDILAELGDAAAIIGFAMREIEKRRNA